MDRIHSCESFFSCLKDNKSLQVLNLSYAKIRNYGAEELAKVVNTTRLVEINLTRCGIEEEGIKALATALVSNVHLSILRLDDTNISPAALRCVSYSLRHNNSLKILGMVEDPVTTELTEENLVEFIVNLCYNSSVVCIVLNNIRLLAPSLQQAVAFVNCTRRVKQQPQLSIDDEYTQNYNPELYNDMGLRASDIRTQALKSIDVSIVTASDGSFLLKELPIQVWNQTLLSSLQFIEKPKAIRSMSMSHILQPNSQTIHINTLARTIKSPYSEVAVPRQAFTQQELWSQERHQTLSCTLQFIDKSKAIRNMSMRQILQPSSRVICINTLVRRNLSQYSVVVDSLQTFTQHETLTQEWHQTMFCTLQFIDRCKALRNMCMSQILQLNCRTININVPVRKQNIRGCAGSYGEILCRFNAKKTLIDLQQECYEYVYTRESLGLLLSMIHKLNFAPDIGRTMHDCIHPLAQTIQKCLEVPLPTVIIVNSGSITCHVFYKQSNSFSILLINVFGFISSLLGNV